MRLFQLRPVSLMAGQVGRRLDTFSQSVKSGQVARRVAEDVVWAKFRSLRDGARIASERLF